MRVRDDELDGQPVRWREADGGDAPVLYVHGVPTAGWDWEPFLAATGGIAPDLPGFGQSGKRADLAYTPEFFGDWLERFLEWRGIDRVRLVVHDWGAVGLVWAQAHAERVERLVVMNAIPLLPGYSWHRLARLWRTRAAGEVAMGASTKFATRRLLGEATPRGAMPDEFVDRVVEAFDLGTQRAILRLYRAGDPPELARLGERLGSLTCPALVVWGEQDAYIGPEFAQRYAEALGGEVRVELLPDAGHWPWLDEPALVERVASFLES